MKDRVTVHRTCLFVFFLLLAGGTNALSRTGMPVFDALMSTCNHLIYAGLLLHWSRSVMERLMPSRAKNRMIGAALLMLFYHLLRVFKYRAATEPAVMRGLIYLYFAPMTLIPTLFLMTCLCIRRGNRPGGRGEALLLIPPGLLSLIALTNDFHLWMYRPKTGLTGFAVDTGTYTNGPMFYAQYAWMILSFASGLLLLFRETGLRARKALVPLAAVVGLSLGGLLLYALVFDGTGLPRMYNPPEIYIFGMLGVFEVCVRHRLIPHNADYADCFAALRTPALVTDEALRPVFRSGGALTAGTEQLRAALASPVRLTPDLKLSGRAVHGGYAFWTEDETEVHRAQDHLTEANELIESENSLIRAETEQREKDAWLQSRHRIYHEIAERLYPCQQRIEGLLGRMEPGTPAFREQLARVSVLNAYVKRKTNLLLLSAEQDSLTTQALFLALKESANYLSLAGLKTGVRQPEEERPLPAAAVIGLYDAFEAAAEQLMGNASSLMISWQGGALVLATETARIPDLGGLPVPVRVQEEEGILYMELPAQGKDGKGGERA